MEKTLVYLVDFVESLKLEYNRKKTPLLEETWKDICRRLDILKKTCNIKLYLSLKLASEVAVLTKDVIAVEDQLTEHCPIEPSHAMFTSCPLRKWVNVGCPALGRSGYERIIELNNSVLKDVGFLFGLFRPDELADVGEVIWKLRRTIATIKNDLDLEISLDEKLDKELAEIKLEVDTFSDHLQATRENFDDLVEQKKLELVAKLLDAHNNNLDHDPNLERVAEDVEAELAEAAADIQTFIDEDEGYATGQEGEKKD